MEKKKKNNIKRDIIWNYIVVFCFLFILWLFMFDKAIADHNIVCMICDIFILVLWAIICIAYARDRIDRRIIRFKLLSNEAMLPEKDDGDAGYDIYASFEDNWIIIEPHTTEMIPTGIASAFSNDYVAVLKERGSTGTRGMGQRAGIIDASYRGEWFVPITNHNDYPIAIVKEVWLDEFKAQLDAENIKIYPYNKAICQALFLPVPKLNIEQISKIEFAEKYANTKRGEGALGSSGK